MRERTRQKQQAGDRGERELEAHVEEDRGTARQHQGGRHEPEEPAVGRPRRQAGEQRDDPRHAGAHDRGRRSGDHDVEHDRGDEDQRAQIAAHAGQRENEGAHGAEQHDVLARYGEDVEQAAALHVGDGAGRHGLVVAEHHGLEDLAHRRTQAAADVAARRQAQPVDEAREPAAPPGEPQRGERRGEHDVLAAPLEVAPVVEGAGLGRRRRFDLDGRERQARALDERPERRERRRRRGAEVERERGTFGQRRAVHGGHRDVEADAVAVDLGQGERGRPHGHGPAGERREEAMRLGVEPRCTDTDARRDEQRRQRERGRALQPPAPRHGRPAGGGGRRKGRDRKRRVSRASAHSAAAPVSAAAPAADGRQASAPTRPPT